MSAIEVEDLRKIGARFAQWYMRVDRGDEWIATWPLGTCPAEALASFDETMEGIELTLEGANKSIAGYEFRLFTPNDEQAIAVCR